MNIKDLEVAAKYGPENEDLNGDCDGGESMPRGRQTRRQTHGRKYRGIQRQRL